MNQPSRTENQEVPLPAPHKRSWQDWQVTQPPFNSPDPRFDQRSSSPDDFPEIYALLNTAFDGKRTIAELEWIYEENPYGKARSDLAIDTSSGAIVSTNGRFAWPLCKGDEEMELTHVGDSATLPQMQRQGIMGLRRAFQESHPWNFQQIVMSLPNEASRAAIKKYNRPDVLVAQIPFAKKILDWRRFLTTKGVPGFLAKIVAPLAKAITRSACHKPNELRIEPIDHFGQEHQILSLSCSRTDGFWCPHGAQWMNWRYFGHPTKKYVARGLYSGDELKAFAVVQLNGNNAMLMELISPSIEFADILLSDIEGVAFSAGAVAIDTYASESWKQWPALKRRYYVMRPSNIYISIRSTDIPEALCADNWQFLPGDSDVF